MVHLQIRRLQQVVRFAFKHRPCALLVNEYSHVAKLQSKTTVNNTRLLLLLLNLQPKILEVTLDKILTFGLYIHNALMKGLPDTYTRVDQLIKVFKALCLSLPLDEV